MTLRGEGDVKWSSVWDRCRVSREAVLAPVLLPSLNLSSNTVSAPMMPGSARYHITTNLLFTYRKRDVPKMCGRKGSEKRRGEINKSRRHLMKTRRRKIEQDE